ncbi:zinc ribbon domain-containing protein [Klebsiella grimontii]
MLESIREFTSSAYNTAINRVKNPAFGAFAISWCAFNWKQILYLLFADNSIYYKIEYISENSNWLNIFLLPVFSSLVLCIGLPWLNNAISKLQSKPLDNADSIENFKQARKIQRSTRLQRLKAKHDVTYDKVKTGAEKDIQSMKEQITESQSRMGELTNERDQLLDKLRMSEKEYKRQNNYITNLKTELESTHIKLKSLENENEDLKGHIDKLKEPSLSVGLEGWPSTKIR